MNDTEVTKTIEQMVRFIRQEAEEKASEIQVSAEEEFNISKLQILETEKSRIRAEFERREAAVEVKKKVEYSKQLNESRIKVLQAREGALQTLLAEADGRLAELSKSGASYEKLLVKLAVQAYGKIAEPEVLVRFREVDAKLAPKVLAAAAEEFKKAYGKDAPKADLDEAHPLPPPPTKDTIGEGFSTCAGGVVVTSADGRIVCSNTLDDRLKIVYSQNLPAVRGLLFGTA